MQCIMRAYSDSELHCARYGVLQVNQTFKKLLLARLDLVRQTAKSNLGLHAIEFVDSSCRYFSHVPIHLTEEQEADLDEGEVIVFADDIGLNEELEECTDLYRMMCTVNEFWFTSYEPFKDDSDSDAHIYTEHLNLEQIMRLEAEFFDAEENGTGVA